MAHYTRKTTPLVLGVGVNDLKLSNKKDRHTLFEVRVYDLWLGILTRCYSERFLKLYPSYRDCRVCERWLTISNFMQDIQELEGFEYWRDNPYKGICLDKDIKGNGKKLYSKDTCCFVDRIDNIRERNARVGNPALYNVKPVICIKPTGEIIRYSSIAEATKDGFYTSGVVNCCKNIRRTHKGCQFRYA